MPLDCTAGILVLCMGDPLGSPCRDDLPLVPQLPPSGAGWGSCGGLSTGAASTVCWNLGGSWPETSQAVASRD